MVHRRRLRYEIPSVRSWFVNTLSSEEVFNATKNGFCTYGKFFKAVAKEIGMERALELHGYGYEDYGPVFDEMFNKLSLEELSTNVGGMLTSLGYDAKISQTANSVIATTHGCPEYEGYKEAGLNHETIKKTMPTLSGINRRFATETRCKRRNVHK